MAVRREHRLRVLQQTSKVIWFTGLSGSGKSTLASALEYELFRRNFKTFLLDGDNIRSGINSDLGFTAEDRKENIRRTSEISKLFFDAGLITLAAFISPFKEDRYQLRRMFGDTNFIEVFVDCPLNVCESRDVKGLYKKARSGILKDFTGIDSPYEIPEAPSIIIYTDRFSINQCVNQLIDFIIPRVC